MVYVLSKRLGVCVVLAVLAACQQQPSELPPGQVKIGKPYVIDGKTYYPEYDAAYDKTGEASWYGPGFHGKYTANGEIFNQDDLTAAHPTLPMPSLVRVTNLTNGKSLIVRINDRGPFKNNRIIDLSKASAQRLGIAGVNEVRVQFLPKETSEYLAGVGNGSKAIDMFALNESIGDQSSEGYAVGGSHAQVAVETTQAAPVSPVSSEPEPAVVAQKQVFSPPPRASEPAPQSRSQAALIREVWSEDEAVAVAEPPAKTKATQPVQLTRSAPAKAAASGVKEASISPASGGSLIIQVGSFSTEQNAKKIKGKLSTIGDVAIDKVTINDKVWYRVRLGPFNDKGSAEAALSRVQASGAPDARITRRI